MMLAQIYSPLCALALFNCIAATIQDRDKSKLKLKRIPLTKALSSISMAWRKAICSETERGAPLIRIRAIFHA